MSVPSEPWQQFYASVRSCRACEPLGVINVLSQAEQDPAAAWGLAWYDLHRQLDGGVTFVGMDFGNIDSVNAQRACRALDPTFVPGTKGPGRDNSFVRFRAFLESARMRSGTSLATQVYVTNAALCVRPAGAIESGPYGDGSIYTACTQHLRAQLNLTRPYAIVALGIEALKAVRNAVGLPPLPKGTLITRIAGQSEVATVNKARVAVYPFLHPSRRQDLHGWDDEAQRRLYQSLADYVDSQRESENRESFRLRFGVLP